MCSTEKPTESIHIYSATVLRVSPASDNQKSFSPFPVSDLVPIQQKETFGNGIKYIGIRWTTIWPIGFIYVNTSTELPSADVKSLLPRSIDASSVTAVLRLDGGWMVISGRLSSRGYKHLINSYTPSENWHISPENSWLEDEVAFQNGPFSGDMLIIGG